MDLKYSEEQELLRRSADSFLAARRGQGRVALPSAEDERATWAAIAAMGWLGLPIAAEFDGFGLGHVEIALVTEALGRHLVSVPYLSGAVIAPALIGALADEERKRALLPAIAAGERRLGFAHVEPGAAREPGRTATTAARRDGDGWVLDGAKVHALDGRAEQFLVTASVAGAGMALFLVPAEAPGVSVTPVRLLDGSTVARIAFDGAALPGEALIGRGEAVRAAVDTAIESALVACCAELTGLADAVLAATIAYVNTREQFGRTIGSNQVVRHRIVDMGIALEEARALTLRAAILADGSDRAAASLAASAAKAKAGRAARAIAEQAVQLHGAIGVTDELEIGAYLKRVLALEPLFGAPADHELAFARRRSAARATR